MGELYRLVLSLSKGGGRKDERGKKVKSRKWIMALL